MKREHGGLLGRMLAVLVVCAVLLFGLTSNPALANEGNSTEDEPYAQTAYTIPERVATVTVTDQDESYEIVASADPEKGGEVSGTGTYTYGQTATLTATPAEGYVFDCWTENGERILDENAKATYAFTVTDARTLVANFRKVIISTTIDDQTYTGKPITPSIPAADVSLVGVDYAVQSKDYELSYESNVHAGTASVILTFSGAFSGTARKTFTIRQARLTVTAVSATREYDGTALTATYECEGLVEGDAIESVEVTGSQTNVGETTCEAKNAVVTNETYGQTTADYDIEYKSGKLKVTPYSKKVTAKITGHSDTKTYDGNVHEVSGYEFKPDVDFYVASDYAFKGTASVKATDIGVYPMGLSAEDFSNKSANFADVVFEVTDGSLTIVEPPKATLTFDLAGGTLNGKTGKVTVDANVGDTIKLPAAPTRDGYVFRCWKGSEYAAGANYKVEGDHLFTADWKVKDYPKPTMSNSKGGSFASTTDEITYTVLQKVPDWATSLRMWVDLESVLQYTSAAGDVKVTTTDGTAVNAKVAIDGQRLTVTVADASALRGNTLRFSYKAKLRADAKLDNYLNSSKNTASVPYQAHTVFDGEESHAVESTKESVKFKVSSSSSSTTTSTSGSSRSTTPSTGDPTSLAVVFASATLGATALAVGRRRRP